MSSIAGKAYAMNVVTPINIPHFVETRGGDYFFVPSLTALRTSPEGLIDPT